MLENSIHRNAIASWGEKIAWNIDHAGSRRLGLDLRAYYVTQPRAFATPTTSLIDLSDEASIN